MARVRKQLKDEYKKDLKDATAPDRKRALKAARDHLEEERRYYNEDLTKAKRDEEKTTHDRDALNVESATELRRMTDLTAKLKRLLADCDLVVLPRFTVHSVIPPFVLRNDFHSLDKAQVEALKSFMADGKPVMAASVRRRNRDRCRWGRARDGMEDLLSQLGIKPASKTILFRSRQVAGAAGRNSAWHAYRAMSRRAFRLPRDDADDPCSRRTRTGRAAAESNSGEHVPGGAGVGRDLTFRSATADRRLPGSDRASLEFERVHADRQAILNEDRPSLTGKAIIRRRRKTRRARSRIRQRSIYAGSRVEKKVGRLVHIKDADPAASGCRDRAWRHLCRRGQPQGRTGPGQRKALIDTANWLIGGRSARPRERPTPTEACGSSPPRGLQRSQERTLA